MKKREFLTNSGILITGAILSPIIGCQSDRKTDHKTTESTDKKSSFILPELDYPYDALEPFIDARTMEIHHSKHHAGYTKKLNLALDASSREWSSDIVTLLGSIESDDTALRNNGGGYYNHDLFWKSLSPKEKNPIPDHLKQALSANFDSVENALSLLKIAGKKQFGSGWAWLIQKDNKELAIVSTPNQDNPLMKNIASEMGTPLLGIDVWEHAYYLKYQSRRSDYLDQILKIIDWQAVANRLA